MLLPALPATPVPAVHNRLLAIVEVFAQPYTIDYFMLVLGFLARARLSCGTARPLAPAAPTLPSARTTSSRGSATPLSARMTLPSAALRAPTG
eukprot:4301740-Alexandrium_andersonii.AAC.1